MSEWIKRLAEKYSEVNEKKLTGNQHKLDMDKDGDIDAADFAHMRKKKKTNEDEVVMNPKKEKNEKKTAGDSENVAQESTLPPVYSRIMEARGTADKDGKHSKKAAPPEDWDEKEKNNKGAMDMKKDMAVDTSDKVSNYDDLGHDDASKAGRATNAAKTRPGDNAAGDKKIVNPVKGATS